MSTGDFPGLRLPTRRFEWLQAGRRPSHVDTLRSRKLRISTGGFKQHKMAFDQTNDVFLTCWCLQTLYCGRTIQVINKIQLLAEPINLVNCFFLFLERDPSKPIKAEASVRREHPDYKVSFHQTLMVRYQFMILKSPYIFTYRIEHDGKSSLFCNL